MCGLLGEFGKVNSSISEFNSLLKLSENRGPDMVGYYNNLDLKTDQIPFLQFGFNRLSILDLTENGNQPILSKSKRYVVMCNGEITNYLDLKNEMDLKENDMRSYSDTEVLCHCLDHYGIRETIDRISGMYAIAIYDINRHKISLIRDAAGIKPLYFAQTKLGWIFASQYNQIFKHPWFKADVKINEESLSDYLRLGYIPAPYALFENSWMVKNGSFITINSELNVYSQKYHDLEDRSEYLETSEFTSQKLSTILGNTFIDYVHSDVPIGSFLSGGVDSPLVNAILSNSGYKMNAFTISTNFWELMKQRKPEKSVNILE